MDRRAATSEEARGAFVRFWRLVFDLDAIRAEREAAAAQAGDAGAADTDATKALRRKRPGPDGGEPRPGRLENKHG